jgi:hypothetical protein
MIMTNGALAISLSVDFIAHKSGATPFASTKSTDFN